MAGTSNAGPTPVRRSARLTSVAPSATPTTASVTGRRTGNATLAKAKPRQSQAYGASGRSGDAEDLSIPDDTGFSQAMDQQRHKAVTRDVEDNSDDTTSRGSSEFSDLEHDLAQVAAYGTIKEPYKSKKAPRAGSSQYPTADAEVTISNTTSLASKSFGVVRESGMDPNGSYLLPSLDPNQSGLSKVIRPLGSRPTPPLFGAETYPRNPVYPSRIRSVMSREMDAVREDNAAASRPASTREVGSDDGHPNEPHTDDTHGPTINPNINRFTWDSAKLFALSLLTYALNLANYVANYVVRKWKTCLKLFMLMTVAVLLSDFVTSPSNSLIVLVCQRTSYSWDGLKSSLQLPSKERPEDEWTPADRQHSFIWNHVENIERDHIRFDKALKSVQEMIPDVTVMVRNKNGDIFIPDEFWRAFESRMRDEQPNGFQATDFAWSEFLNKNQRKISDLISADVSSTMRKTFQPIVRKEVVDMMMKEYAKMATQIDKKFAEEMKSFNTHIAQRDPLMVQSLAFTQMVQNAETSLRKVNYFSRGHGATIDPFMTSSTSFSSLKPDDTWKAKIFGSFLLRQQSTEPHAALEHWNEPGEAFCVSPDEDKTGLAQLSVRLRQEIIPRQVTVEHLPKEASVDYSSAPKDMEFWVKSDEALEVPISCSAGPPGWICLGKFAYNVHASNFMQTFSLDRIISSPITHTMVRVMDNWGSDHTCLYRVRLHGEPASAMID